MWLRYIPAAHSWLLTLVVFLSLTPLYSSSAVLQSSTAKQLIGGLAAKGSVGTFVTFAAPVTASCCSLPVAPLHEFTREAAP
jgi:hypothetical protein